MLVKVWNDHTIDHVEKLRNDTIVIKAGEYIEMTKANANYFLGRYYPGIKKLRIEIDMEADAVSKDQPIKHRCATTAKEFRTDIGFENHKKAMATKATKHMPMETKKYGEDKKRA